MAIIFLYCAMYLCTIVHVYEIVQFSIVETFVWLYRGWFCKFRIGAAERTSTKCLCCCCCCGKHSATPACCTIGGHLRLSQAFHINNTCKLSYVAFRKFFQKYLVNKYSRMSKQWGVSIGFLCCVHYRGGGGGDINLGPFISPQLLFCKCPATAWDLCLFSRQENIHNITAGQWARVTTLTRGNVTMLSGEKKINWLWHWHFSYYFLSLKLQNDVALSLCRVVVLSLSLAQFCTKWAARGKAEPSVVRECKLDEMRYRGAACLIWRRFSNLFETGQSLFWATFGLVSLADFELAGIKVSGRT